MTPPIPPASTFFYGPPDRQRRRAGRRQAKHSSPPPDRRPQLEQTRKPGAEQETTYAGSVEVGISSRKPASYRGHVARDMRATAEASRTGRPPREGAGNMKGIPDIPHHAGHGNDPCHGHHRRWSGWKVLLLVRGFTQPGRVGRHPHGLRKGRPERQLGECVHLLLGWLLGIAWRLCRRGEVSPLRTLRRRPAPRSGVLSIRHPAGQPRCRSTRAALTETWGWWRPVGSA
jgi:hypothetical protein